jgi:hypothetical protein
MAMLETSRESLLGREGPCDDLRNTFFSLSLRIRKKSCKKEKKREREK